MSNYITILTANHPAEMAVVASRLEDEGIDHYIENEYMAQSHAFLSRASGGARLMILEEDRDRVIAILKETGKLTEGDLHQVADIEKFDQSTSRVPLLKEVPAVVRFLVLVGMGAVGLILLVYLFS